MMIIPHNLLGAIVLSGLTIIPLWETLLKDLSGGSLAAEQAGRTEIQPTGLITYSLSSNKKVIPNGPNFREVYMPQPIVVPHEFKSVLQDFTIAYLIDNPSDIPSFGLKYFHELRARRTPKIDHRIEVRTAGSLDSNVTGGTNTSGNKRKRRSDEMTSSSKGGLREPVRSAVNIIEKTTATGKLSAF